MKKTILLFSLLVLGCKSLKKAEYKSTIKKIPTKILIDEIENRKPQYDFLSIRSQSTFTENNSTNQFNLGIRIQKNEKILITGSILIPLFKALLTKDKVAFYEKISRNFYRGGYQYLSSMLNHEFSLSAFQKMLTGQPITNFSEIKWKQLNSLDSYILESYYKKKDIISEYRFNPIDFTLISQKITSKKNTLIIEYENYQLVDGSFFPQKIKILANSQGNELKVSLGLKTSKTGNPNMFSFEIPKGFKELKL